MTLRNRKVHSAGGGLDSGCHESLLPTGGEDEAHPVDNHLDDVVLLERLRTKCEIEPGAMDDSAHDELLGRIWDTAYPTEPFVCPSQRWKELGFQGTDPRTDLRGAGGMSLTHFATYLLRAHGEEEDTGFPLSIASINCTGMLQAHLQLNPTLAVSFAGPGGGKVEPCSAETLHRFLHLASSRGGPDTAVASLELVLTQMHGALLDHLRSEWRALQGEARGKSPLTIMDFPRALHATHAHLQRTLATFGRHRTWGAEQLVDELAAGRVGVGAGFGAGMGAGLGAGLGLGGCQMEGLRAAWECLFVTPMAAAFLVLRDVLRTLNGALGCGGDCYRPSLKHHQS